ncbi:MAG: phosphate regulon sensor histidine kinase PhoR [Acidobacteriota bacterium]
MKKRRSILKTAYPPILAVFFLAVAASAWYGIVVLRQSRYEEVGAMLRGRARLAALILETPYRSSDRAGIQQACKRIGSTSGVRVMVIRADGTVVGDSGGNPSRLESFADRPEVGVALSGKESYLLRTDFMTGRKVFYFAAPISGEGMETGVVRLSIPLKKAAPSMWPYYFEVLLAALFAFFAGGVFIFWALQRVDRSFEQVDRTVEQFAGGHFEFRAAVPPSQPLAHTSENLDRLSERVRGSIHSITQERDDLETVLANMMEAVIVVDNEDRILRLNQAACNLFGLQAGRAVGRTIQEVVRSTDLQEFLEKVRASNEALTGTVVHYEDERQQFLHANGIILRDNEDRAVAALLVLHDITHLKQLENMRKDFVANVSHELKTPITSIKGFVETLKDGAVQDPEKAQAFLDIVGRQVDRLTAIIDDLLSLSRIEQDAEKHQIPLSGTELRPVLEAALAACEPRASTRGVKLSLACGDDLQALMNATLLEEAVLNLVDNAVKYSEAGGDVQVNAFPEADWIKVQVRDHGAGIPKEHLPRLFERFYRVDKARSRKMGGTGLGLAIVKHIVQAHQGEIAVESEPGKGTTFTVFLRPT